MNKDVSQADFSAIVSEILNRCGDVEAFTVSDKSVSVSIFSRLRRERAKIFFDFDDSGRITGRFSYAQTQDGSSLPQILGNEIAEYIRRFRSG